MSDERTEDLARESLAHLQKAAQELIAAARTLIDAVEEVVEDSDALRSAVTGLGALAQSAADQVRRAARAGGATGDDEGDDGGVERITVR